MAIKLPRNRRLRAWLEGRISSSQTVTLSHRSVYIIPTRFGLMFTIVLLVLLAGSINYTLGLGYVLTFALAGLALVGLLHTWRNLAGLTFRAGKAEPVFAGDTAAFEIHIHSPRGAHALLLEAGGPSRSVDVEAGTDSRVQLPVPAPARGLLPLPRILAYTWFPLGLFRSWSWLDLRMQAVVYPRPAEDLPPLPPALGDEDQGQQADRGGWEDFWGLRAWHEGDSPRHVAWKALARTDVFLTKEFSNPVGGLVWLDWNRLAGGDIERRLSLLARWVLELDGKGLPYGLRLPELEIPPGIGEAHRHRCLYALALFGRPEAAA